MSRKDSKLYRVMKFVEQKEFQIFVCYILDSSVSATGDHRRVRAFITVVISDIAFQDRLLALVAVGGRLFCVTQNVFTSQCYRIRTK